MRKLLLFIGCITGCTSEARLPTSYFAETSRVLDKNAVSVTAAVGASRGASEIAGGGGRVCAGIGGDKEVGIEAAQSRSTFLLCDCDLRSTLRTNSGSLSLKTRIGQHAALIYGLGATQHEVVAGPSQYDARGTSATGSVALLGSQPLGPVEVYAGGRLTGAVPLTVYRREGGTAEGVLDLRTSVAIGVATPPGPLRLFVEAGPQLTFQST